MKPCHCRICDGTDYTCTDCPGGVLMDATDDGPAKLANYRQETPND